MNSEGDAGNGTPRFSREHKNGHEVITLCGTQGCCPTVEKTDDGKSVVIRDDHGSSVELTLAEFSALQAATFER